VVWDSNPGRGKEFLSSPNPNPPDLLCGPTVFLSKGYRSNFPKVIRPGRDANHTSTSSARVKHDLSCTFMPSYASMVSRRTTLPLKKEEKKVRPETW